ncbi:hypothetical protein ACJ41O_002158 [Fusarium nematophilum]
MRSFHSSSSRYSDPDKNDQQGIKNGLVADSAAPSASRQGNRTLMVPETKRNDELLKRFSLVSTSTDDDPFKYDRDPYSGFLQASAERDVSDALHRAGVSTHSNGGIPRIAENTSSDAQKSPNNVDEEIKVPVGEKNKEPSPGPIPDRRLSGGIVTLLKNRPQTGTEGDWQTVTTDHPFNSMQQEFHDSLAKGTGSSLADVSDMSERELHPHEYRSTDKIIQHPFRDAGLGPYRVRNDKRTNVPVLVPQFGGRGPGHFAVNTARNLVPPSRRLSGSAARFSHLFRKDGEDRAPNRQSLLTEMETRRDSYQTLDSDSAFPEARMNEETTTGGMERNAYFRWSRIRENLGRERPKTPLTILDQPLYRRGIKESDEANKSTHVPHDDFLSKIPRLHFPLISLPEAALLQHFKRERGEEDHTESARSFVARGRSSTLNTADSTALPQTPSPSRLHFSTGSPGLSLPRPPPAHYPRRANEVLRRRDSSQRISDMLVSSSAILDTPPPTDPRFGTNGGWYRGLHQDFTAFYDGLPRVRGFSSSTRDRRAGNLQAGYLPAEGSLFTQSETDLIETAREDIRLRRRLADVEDDREKMIFMGIMILTLFFPFIGLLALWGKFDSTVSWYTHGEMHSLTKDQRGTLKQQLLVEAVVNPVLIITLSLYYSMK